MRTTHRDHSHRVALETAGPGRRGAEDGQDDDEDGDEPPGPRLRQSQRHNHRDPRLRRSQWHNHRDPRVWRSQWDPLQRQSQQLDLRRPLNTSDPRSRIPRATQITNHPTLRRSQCHPLGWAAQTTHHHHNPNLNRENKAAKTRRHPRPASVGEQLFPQPLPPQENTEAADVVEIEELPAPSGQRPTHPVV